MEGNSRIYGPYNLLTRDGQLHTEGKTDEAKADLARLAKIRAEREAAAAKRKAEAEGKLPVPRSILSVREFL